MKVKMFVLTVTVNTRLPIGYLYCVREFSGYTLIGSYLKFCALKFTTEMKIHSVSLKMALMLAAIIAFKMIQVLQGYEVVIAVYNSTGEVNSCSFGANYSCGINDLLSKSLESGTLLKFCSEIILLNRKVNLTDISNIGLTGFMNTKMKCTGKKEEGIVLKYIRNLELKNITFEKCGVWTSVGTYQEIKAGVIIQNSTNITITSLIVLNSPGSGLALFYNNGLIRIQASVFEGNGYDRHSGGNGVYIETGPSSFIVSDADAKYNFDKCHFCNNTAVTEKDKNISGFSRFDKGGGMCIHIRGSENVNIQISNSIFAENQVVQYGGGLFATYNGKSSNNSVSVLNSQFIGNKAAFGGALYSGYLHDRHKHVTPQSCSFSFQRVTFHRNIAEFGGGCSIFSTSAEKSKSRVNFENCSWTQNSGQYGAALAILPNAWNLYSREMLPSPQFINCTLAENIVNQLTLQTTGQYSEYSRGSGVFHCLGHRFTFEATTVFENNDGTGLYLDSCAVTFSLNSVSYFTNNSGYQGGAINELSSVIYILDGAEINFICNNAEDKGGAIFEHATARLIYDYSRTCFIDYFGTSNVSERNISVNFVNNTASNYGYSIYASTLIPCYNRFKVPVIGNMSSDIFNEVGNFTFIPRNRYRDLATAVNKTIITVKNSSIDLLVIPGKQTTLPFKDVDDIGWQEETNYLIEIKDEVNITAGQEVSHNVILLNGESEISATVVLTDLSPRKTSLRFQVTMQACPPGFIHEENTQSCICAFKTADYYFGIDTCNLTVMRAHRKEGYWIGYDPNRTENENSLLSGMCPRGFCSYGKSNQLPEEAAKDKLDNLICAESRTGILCGQCKQDFSVYFHNFDFECKPNHLCNLGWFFYILSEIIPVTGLFLFILSFNISFTSGLTTGFVFFCQVVEVIRFQSLALIPHTGVTQVLQKISSLLYLSFSLDMFAHDQLSFCLWKSAKAIDIHAFKFVTLLYALFLVLSITFAVKYCTRSWRCGQLQKYTLLYKRLKFEGGVVHALSTFFILCYAQCARSSFMLLTSATIYHKGFIKFKTTVYVDGEMEWMGAQHLPYAVPAILAVVFVLVLPPLLLLIYPLHSKILLFLRVGETRCVQIVFGPLNKMKPFFDSFQSCFRDKFRFFSGLYFVYRFFIMFNVVIYYFQESFFYLEIQLIMMLIIHAICQPYKKYLHNVIDTLLIGNLATINFILYYLSLSSATTFYTELSSVVLCALITLPIPLMCVCILFLYVCEWWRKFRGKRNGCEEDKFEEIYHVDYKRFR